MAESSEGTPTAAAKLMEIAWGYWASQLLRQTAEMGLADKFDHGAPMPTTFAPNMACTRRHSAASCDR
jgi:hypothetical protein